MSTSAKQRQFMKCVNKLLTFIHEIGHEVTLGDGYRDPRVHGEFGEKKSYSASKSVHKMRLAIDLNLWVLGKYITDGEHPAWPEIGEYWESLDPLARWGGRFDDANHFSFEIWGCK